MLLRTPPGQTTRWLRGTPDAWSAAMHCGQTRRPSRSLTSAAG